MNNIRPISLLKLIDFALQDGGGKASVVKQYKKEADGFDFYALFKSDVRRLHKNNKPVAELSSRIEKLNDEVMVKHYPTVIKAYQEWCGNKVAGWFSPPSSIWSHRGLDVRVEPDIGVTIYGAPYVIALWCSISELKRGAADIGIHLMERQLRAKVTSTHKFAVLDVRRKRLWSRNTAVPNGKARVHAEAAHWVELWNSL